ncbi:MAG: hypothetical protein A3H64_03190 [Candidatus Ryanbacteria bacterium RIFCSPLOWO2_02_FULL_45_11c]|uniref:Uncharacterized protein n=1 Tax=Candidatus Ryanbacteria bacterium RIFCSPLOWO2_02_FULL_45_11c TaxID=1802128 RepID=A0A1G2GU66_9BACT|nr:MAG: hypothetical protein A3H64_03190 [Candidatus Ryanbacteria bacterium RIFCSPLOWO2_02_FULL_45_11c]
MDQGSFEQSNQEKGGDKEMSHELDEFEAAGEKAEEELFKLNKNVSPERNTHLEATQDLLGALHGGSYVETMQFVKGARPKTEETIKGFLGDTTWSRLEELAQRFFNTHMPPAAWHVSLEKKELDSILERIWINDRFRKMILKQMPTPDEEIR